MRTMKHLAIAAMAATALALAGCGGGGSSGGPDTAAVAAEMQRQANITAATNAVMAASDAVDALNAASSEENIMAAQGLIDTAQEAIDGLAEADQTDLNAALAAVQGRHDSKEQLAMLASEDEKRKAQAEADAMMAARATALKLYAGISAPEGTAPTLAPNDRWAAYNDAGTPTDAAVDAHILVSNSGDTALTAAIVLSEDKKTTVADNHGWAGKRYADPAGGDMVEAFVYSNVEDPTEGRKFGSAAAVTATGAYEYQLDSDGVIPSTFTFVAANVAFANVDRTAGTEVFRLPSPNREGADVVLIPGSYHGVSGQYECTPGTAANGCSASVAAKGFTLASGDTWTFRPSNAEARVMDSADDAYASYGWWLHKTENGNTFTASAFHDYRGTDSGTVGIADLRGGATYMGGAAGKYALQSLTGGTNDAGHFTARARLEATFAEEHTITGTIDQFIGADGESRDWSVALKEGAISDVGAITRAAMNDTVWTIGDDDAAASGSWAGTLREQGTDGVPGVATGTFYTEFGTAGRMVGAFGANEQ